MIEQSMLVKETLGQLIESFFRAVSFETGDVPNYESIHDLFIGSGLLIKNSGVAPEISSIARFVEPRREMVRNGELTRFHESELFESTEVFGNIAHRLSGYEKSGTMMGLAFEARGMISTQFIRTPQGWKMSCMAWDDERPGLALPGR